MTKASLCIYSGRENPETILTEETVKQLREMVHSLHEPAPQPYSKLGYNSTIAVEFGSDMPTGPVGIISSPGVVTVWWADDSMPMYYLDRPGINGFLLQQLSNLIIETFYPKGV